MRLPNAEHRRHPWRIHDLVPDFTLEDVWALPMRGGLEDFGGLLELAGSFDPSQAESGPTRFLWNLRDRLPPDLRGSAADFTFGSLPFVPLYRTDREAAAELSNKTVHGVAHLAWVDLGGGHYEGRMAVYVKPRGAFGRAYMALIKPFRYWVVYPALMRQMERAWDARRRGVASAT